MARLVALCLVVGVVAGCGDDGGNTCGTGTTLVNGECVANTTTCGTGTHEMDGACVPDETSTATAIGPVTGLTATVASGVVTLSWTNPTEATFDSVIVVRRGSLAVVAAPSAGATYMMGNSLADGASVVATTMSTSAMDATAKPGLAFYAVFARDTAGNWSAPARVSAVLPLPAQTATISIALAGGPTATVTTQPANFHLSATPILNGADMTVQIRITSGVERPVFNTKLVVTSTNQGTVTGTGDLDGSQYVWFGRGGMLPGTTRQKSLTITGATGGADPILLNVKIQDDPMLIANQLVQSTVPLSLVDTGTGVSDEPDCTESLVDTAKPGGGACSFTSGVLSADSRTLYIGYRNLPVLAAFDTSTFQVFGGVELAQGIGMVGAVAADPTGATIYAVVNTGQHGTYGNMTTVGGRRAGQIDLVRLDAVTLAETGRLMLRTTPTGANPPQAKDLAISPDGKFAAIPISGSAEVRVVDLATLTQLTPLDVTAAGSSPRSVVFTADSTQLAIGYSGAESGPVNDGTITVASTSTWAQTQKAPSTAVGDGTIARIARAPDGTIWVMRNHGDGLSVFSSNLATETQYETVNGLPGAPQAVAFSADGAKAYIVNESDELSVFSVATPALQEVTPMNRVGGHFVMVTPY